MDAEPILIQLTQEEWDRIKTDAAERDAKVERLRVIYERLSGELDERDKTIEYLRGQIGELQEARDGLVNSIIGFAPECWDGDEAAESLCEDYVRSLDSNTTSMPGHRDDCTCWE